MLTLIFSTYNGAQTLPVMLAALRRIERPEGLRIVAIDNRSSDGTLALLRQASRDLPITILQCSEPGKNRSLNFAIDAIADQLNDKELVVVTDDDIVPDAQWLLELSRAAASNPQASVFGGVISPVWPQESPDWLPSLKNAYPVLFAATEARHGPCSSRDIYGPNMAVRARLFKKGVRFDPNIGPDGTSQFGMGSESELLRRLERAGHRLFFSEYAVVGHQIKPSLLNWRSVMSRARRYGRGLGMLDGPETNPLFYTLRTLIRLVELELKALATYVPAFANRRANVQFRREVERGRLTGLRWPSIQQLLRAPRSGQLPAGTAAKAATAVRAAAAVNRP